MKYNYHTDNQMKTFRETVRAACFSVFWMLVLVVSTVHTSYAQSYVPVNDDDLNSAFSDYADAFDQYTTDLFDHWDDTFGKDKPNGTTDSLRDLLSGSDPKMSSLGGKCANGDNVQHSINTIAPLTYAAFPYTDPDTPWQRAIASSGVYNGVPDGAVRGGPYIQVNKSESLRCLLIEITEWQRLALSVQIHSLLKDYISNAQQAQLTKQLKNRMTAANLQFAKSGNQVNNNGALSSAPVFVTNYNQNLYNVNGRQIDALSDQAAADPAAPGPQGSLGICQPWRIDAAANVVRNARTRVEDPFKYTDTATKCSLTDPTNGNFTTEAGYNSFQANFNDPATKNGGYNAYMDMLHNPQNTPLGSIQLLDEVAEGRLAQQEKSTEAEAANSGFLPTKVCSGDAADPHCLDDQYSLAANPSGQNQGNITNLTQRMNDELTSDAIDSQTSSSSQRAPTDINTNTGLMSADTLPLETSGTAINNLVREFQDVIEYGYLGINTNTTQWAQGTMLMIYDEMKFSQDLSAPNGGASVVTNVNDAVPTGY